MPSQKPKQPLNPASIAKIAPGYRAMGASWRLSMKARNVAQRTIDTYLDTHLRFGVYLVESKAPQQVTAIKRPHVQGFIEDQLARYSPSTANHRYRCLQQFFRWLVEEEEIDETPMAHMSPPKIPEAPPPVIPIEQIQAILKACAGKDFRARRDYALIRILIDTGARRGGFASMTVGGVNLEAGEITVVEKESRTRVISIGAKATAALDRYLRARAQHPRADEAALWLGHEGPMTSSGIYQVVRDRAAEAGLPGVYVHLFRHTWADQWLAGGGQEGDAMELAGWKSRSMLDRYGRAARSKRAREAHKRLSPGDRI